MWSKAMSSELDNIMEQALQVKDKMDKIILADHMYICMNCGKANDYFIYSCFECDDKADNAGELWK